MGAVDCFRAIICRKKAKVERTKQAKAGSATPAKSNGSISSIHAPRQSGVPGKSVEDIAAVRIQTVFRAYLARRTLSRLKGVVRFHVLTRGQPVQEQISSTLNCMHSWSRIQSQIRARRFCMVTEARLRQKKLENQLKFEAKLHKLEVEWCGESGTMEEILARIQQREEAAVKRERAMAYAFSHQWRANASQYLGQTSYCIDKENWGWSWLQHWVAARPWEFRVETNPLNKGRIRQVSRSNKSKRIPELIIPVPENPGMCNLY
ncbi:protein IQ-DOMAIN 1 [Punica granatum]|uniref:Uncharacterized protein n=2 Tax=Punica granatum TaxID=22663 RepID=A0A218XVJ7_PUNGR|nr:protein IQ-DOMAIN 1 [Punica granatum]OWM88619.1 hypothetical protein CDL15_Pgr002386 [Punica granatum]PKI37686.1 hypothetical protein CRG98_041979 [Punica granatum]